MGEGWSVEPGCETPEKSDGIDSKDDALDAVDTHVVFCDECDEEDVIIHPPTEPVTDDGQTATADGGTAAVPATQADNIEIDADTAASETEFATNVAGVPSVFVKNMGTDDDKSPYVTKEGLLYLSRQLDFQVSAEPVVPSWEVDEGKVVYKGIVEDDDGRTWEDYGTATYGEEIVGDENLDELASTRATNRALRLATGAGMTSLEEMEAGAPNAVADDPDVVDVEEVNADA